MKTKLLITLEPGSCWGIAAFDPPLPAPGPDTILNYEQPGCPLMTAEMERGYGWDASDTMTRTCSFRPGRLLQEGLLALAAQESAFSCGSKRCRTCPFGTEARQFDLGEVDIPDEIVAYWVDLTTPATPK